jgi:hypothetical protein
VTIEHDSDREPGVTVMLCGNGVLESTASGVEMDNGWILVELGYFRDSIGDIKTRGNARWLRLPVSSR